MPRRAPPPRESTVVRQRRFAFVEQAERRDRLFRRAILAATALAVVGLAGLTSTGRDGVRRATAWARGVAWTAVGIPRPRSEIEAETARRRARDVETASATFRRVYDEASPAVRRLMRFAGMRRDDALLRTGNYDKVLVLPSAVFAADNSGRSYRLRPNLRSVWLRGVDLTHGMNGFFLVPDTPDLPAALSGTRAGVVPGSAQTTNSWGCRGPEPDPSAPLRGIVLGDSNMQGYFIGDADTPPAFLGREIESRLGVRATVLNTGHLGYSPEQYYYTLVEYTDRLRPQFVVVTLCVNDFGDVAESHPGPGRLGRGAAYWLGRIDEFCRTRGIMAITAPVPYDMQVTGLRLAGNYPGKADDLLRSSSLFTCFAIEDLIDDFLRSRASDARERRPSLPNPLYNLHLGDHHFTPRGAEIWGRAVGRRVALLLDMARSRGLGP